jgi:hypothetical protein
MKADHSNPKALDGEVFWGQDRIELLADAL